MNFVQTILWVCTVVTAAAGGLPAGEDAARRIDAAVRRGSGDGAVPRCEDAVFLRRVHLDATGTLPTAAEARAFLDSADPDKRARLVDRLLATEAYADYWAMRWGDVLRIKAEFPVNLWPNAAQAYHRWVRAAVASNVPYDRFARELLTASGSNFRVGPANFFRAIQNRKPDGIAAAVAQTLMGARIERWPAERQAGLAAFFAQVGYKPTSEWKEEIVFWDPLGLSAVPGNTAPGRAAVADVGKEAVPAAGAATAPELRKPQATTALLPDGTTVELTPDRDPRAVFADWLIRPENPWFARAIANRLWAWVWGRGIVHEPDDLRPDNPPSNPELLETLAREFVAGGYDTKRLLRMIFLSAAYQVPVPECGPTPAAEAAFLAYPLRRLEAEVLIDAINAITGTSDLYTSAIPEPFTYIPEKQPAVAIADGSITSPFLALFGRSARATGTMTERDDRPLPAQWLHLLNSSHIQRKLETGPKLRALFDARRPLRETAEELYLAFLSRRPTPEELAQFAAHGLASGPATQAAPAKGGKNPKAAAALAARRREEWVDLAWALTNSTEFLYRH